MSNLNTESSACNLYLVGFMGSGKSFLGRQLAAYLNWDFVDLDQQIENVTGLAIHQIFHQKGEPYFRLIEKEELQKTSNLRHSVIATGGGAPCFYNNMDWIKGNGKSVYLKVSATILLGRLGDDRIERPLLNEMSLEELSDFIRDSLSKREQFYNQANLVIEADLTSATLLNSIVSLCEED